jgi:hypothetical protein
VDWAIAYRNAGQELQAEMARIDKTLSAKPYYRDDDPISVANERFAYLGDFIGRKDYTGEMPESMKKYYKDIFSHIK